MTGGMVVASKSEEKWFWISRERMMPYVSGR